MSEAKSVAFRFQLSDWTLLRVRRPLLVRGFGLDQDPSAAADLPDLPAGCAGLLLRSIAATDTRTGLNHVALDGRRMLRYVMQCFPRHYIDMAQSFDAYKQKFSGKTLATLRRKVKKFTEHGNGQVRWERFTQPDSLDRFWTLARQVSAKTYQERLLDAGLPEDPAYLLQAKQLAMADNVRAFLLFDGERPVSYLFCPVRDGIVEYAFLGYDPAYLRLSVGTVLQWFALESLFEEQRFRYFDFTEGESAHKRLFATSHLDCANIALLTPTLGHHLLVRLHLGFGRLTEALGRWLDDHDLKVKIRRWMRFGRTAAT